eukprot:3754707-Rhodomonas_salina.1
MDGWMDECVRGCGEMDGWMDGGGFRCTWIDRWMDGWLDVDGWAGGRMAGWVDGRRGEQRGGKRRSPDMSLLTLGCDDT